MKKIVFWVTGISLLAAAAVGIAASVAGIVYTWKLTPGVTERLAATADFTARALDTTEDLLVVVDDALDTVQGNVALMAETTEDVADTLQRTSDMTASVADTMGNELTRIVENTQKALAVMETSARVVDDTLGLFSNLPFVRLDYGQDAPLSTSVSDVNASLDVIPGTLTELQDGLEDTAGTFVVLNDSVSVLADTIAELETSLTEADKAVAEYQTLVDEAQAATARVQTNLPRWVRWAASGLTAVFVWLVVLQIGLILFAWEMVTWRRDNPLLETEAADESGSAEAEEEA